MLLDKENSTRVSILSPLKEENEQIESNRSLTHQTDELEMKNSPELIFFESPKRNCPEKLSPILEFNLDIPGNELIFREPKFRYQKESENQVITMAEVSIDNENKLDKTYSFDELKLTEDAITDLMKNQKITPEGFRKKSDLPQNLSMQRIFTEKLKSPRFFSNINETPPPSTYKTKAFGHVGFSPNMESAEIDENSKLEITFTGNSKKQKLNGITQINCHNEKNEPINYFSPIRHPVLSKIKCRTILEYDEIKTLDFSPEKENKPENRRNLSIVPIEKYCDPCENNLVDENLIINLNNSREPIGISMNPNPDIRDQSSSTDSSINEPMKNKFFFPSRHLRLPIDKIRDFYEWLSKKIFSAMKKAYQKTRQSFTSISPKSKISPNFSEDILPHVISKIQSENEKILSLISQNVNHLTEKMNEGCEKNELNFSVLTKEVEGMRKLSEKLVDDNSSLVQQLKKLSEIVENTRLSNKNFSTSTTPAPIFIPSRLEVSESPPRPPPMPEIFAPIPPPPPMSPLFSRIPKTTISKQSPRRPVKKCPKPPESRPQITVEDLLKVTLKKAPQSNKENRRNSLPACVRGPAISLDMLRSVKLKSARRSSTDGIRSPGRVQSYKSRNRLSLSPMTASNENTPLDRILRHVDGNRRRSIGVMMSPTRSRNRVLSKESSNNNNSPKRTNKSNSTLVE